MTLITKHPKTFVASLLALAVLLSHPSFAQDDDDVRQSVARIAFLSGSASFNRGDDPDSWEDAVVNFPMTVGDRLYTARDGRMELQAEGVRIFLGPESELAALDLRDDIRQLSLTIGTASFRINRLSEGEVFEVDTPNVSLTFQRPGYYRVDVDRDGNTFASIFKGSAVAIAAGGEVDLQELDAAEVLAEIPLLGLRLHRGLDWGGLRSRAEGLELRPLCDAWEAKLRSLQKEGLTVWTGNRVCLSARGMLMSNGILQMFV